MNEQEQINLESSIQDLQAGELGPRATSELLARVAGDSEACRVLAEAIELQSMSRRSCGCEVDDEIVRAGVAQTIGALRAADAAASDESDRKPAAGAMARSIAWPVRIAAAVLIGVCIYVAMVARNDSELMRRQLAILNRHISMPEATARELADLRQVWAEVSGDSEETRPWVFMSNGGGRFGYVPARALGADRADLILLRCAIVDADGKQTKQMNLLLPAGKVFKLDVMDAGRLIGSPVRIAVSASNEWAGMDLEVGTQSKGLVGVKGRARLGAEAAEVGQFRLDGREMKVFLHATRINRTVG